MRELAERGGFALSLALAWLLRSARYSRVRVLDREGVLEVRKSRRLYASLLISGGNRLLRFLDTGVRILPQREWEEREEELCRSFRRGSIRLDAGGELVLPYVAGVTLASLLEDQRLSQSVRRRAIGLAVEALAQFNRSGFTHGDAMAGNVVVDLESGVAGWFDFETVHDTSRPINWRRADDVRALLVTCLVRTVPAKRAGTLGLILDAYGDEAVTRLLASNFSPVVRWPLAFHLAQAGMSLSCYRWIGRTLAEPRERERDREIPVSGHRRQRHLCDGAN